MTCTFEQLDALAMGLSFVEAAGDTSLSQAAKEVRAKLQASLPDPDKRKLENAPLFASRRGAPAGPITKIVRRAIPEAEVLPLNYKDAIGNLTDRRVRQLAISSFPEGVLFAGWGERPTDDIGEETCAGRVCH